MGLIIKPMRLNREFLAISALIYMAAVTVVVLLLWLTWRYRKSTRKSAPGRVHERNPLKCAHGPVFCTSEVTRAGSVPNNPPMGQLLGGNQGFDYLRNKYIVWYMRSNEGATYYFTKYCCVKWKYRIHVYDKIVSIICLNDVLYIHAQGGLQTSRLLIFYTETHHFHMLQHTQEY